MKKPLSILALSLLPTLALAAGSHAGGHAAPAHDMAGHDMSGHDMSGHEMPAMPHESSWVGQPGDLTQVTRTIEVVMLDTMRFSPSEIQVQAGETVRLLVRNAGKLPHELVMGSLADLKAHAVDMRTSPGMTHAEPNALALAPGQQGGLIWKFDQAGMVDFACTIPGHMEAGMVGRVTVG